MQALALALDADLLQLLVLDTKAMLVSQVIAGLKGFRNSNA